MKFAQFFRITDEKKNKWKESCLCYLQIGSHIKWNAIVLKTVTVIVDTTRWTTNNLRAVINSNRELTVCPCPLNLNAKFIRVLFFTFHFMFSYKIMFNWCCYDCCRQQEKICLFVRNQMETHYEAINSCLNGN